MARISGLYIALSGLMANRQATETAGHNVANAKTPGFSRQRVEVEAAGANEVPAVWSRDDGVGRGVDVQAIIRIRDAFLEARAHVERGQQQQLGGQLEHVKRLESLLPEPGDTGLAASLANFWAGWDDVANQPGNRAVRSQMLAKADTLVDDLHRLAADISDNRAAAVTQAQAMLAEANATVTRVAALNADIAFAVQNGMQPNDLMDQRDLLVVHLADTLGVTARQGEHGQVDVFLGGTALVRGKYGEQLEIPEPASGGPTAVPSWNAYEVRWSRDGYPATPGGKLGGVLAAVNTTLPSYMARIDDVAATLVTTVNAIHRTGYGLGEGPAAANRDFFDPAGATAATIGIAAALTGAGAADRIAAAAGGAGPLDASVAQQLAALHDAPTGADVRYRQISGDLGIEVQNLERAHAAQSNVAAQIDRDRDSVAGVNLDEEMTNLVAYQHGYNASARVLTVVDEMLGVLIERTGLVGR